MWSYGVRWARRHPVTGVLRRGGEDTERPRQTEVSDAGGRDLERHEDHRGTPRTESGHQEPGKAGPELH